MLVGEMVGSIYGLGAAGYSHDVSQGSLWLGSVNKKISSRILDRLCRSFKDLLLSILYIVYYILLYLKLPLKVVCRYKLLSQLMICAKIYKFSSYSTYRVRILNVYNIIYLFKPDLHILSRSSYVIWIMYVMHILIYIIYTYIICNIFIILILINKYNTVRYVNIIINSKSYINKHKLIIKITTIITKFINYIFLLLNCQYTQLNSLLITNKNEQ